MSKYLLSFFLILQFLSPVFAQSVEGKIITAENKNLEFVTIKLIHDTTVLQYSSSDQNGNFTFNNLKEKSTYRLKLQHTGFADIDTTFISGHLKKMTFRMTEKVNTLKEVVVNGNKPLIERKVDRLVFNVQNSMVSLSGDAMDVLKFTPLVMAENDALSIIGKGSVTIMVNDKILRISGDDLTSYLRSIPSESIESIEVITVPPSKFSAAGNAGILNIKLKKIVNDFWSASARSIFTQTTHPTINLGAGFNYKKDRLSLYSSLNMTEGSVLFIEKPHIAYNTQDWNTISKKRSFSKYYNGRIQADYKVSEKLSVGAQAFLNDNRPHANDNTITNIMQKTGLLDSIINGNGSQNSTTNSLGLNFNSTYSLGKDGQEIVLDLDHYRSNFDNFRSFNSETFLPNGTPIQNNKWYSGNNGQNVFINTSFNLDVEQKIKMFDINYGINFSTSRNRNNLQSVATSRITDTIFNYSDEFEFKENIGSLFFSINTAISKKIDLKAGLRIENTTTEGISNTLVKKYENKYMKFFPTLYTSYKINEKNVFSLGYGRRIERPAFLAMNPFARYISKYYYTVGNPYLLPSFSHNIEMNYSNNSNLNLSLYTNFAKEQIAQTAIPYENSKMVVDTMQNFYDMSTVGFTAIYTLRKSNWLESSFVFNGYHRNIKQYDNKIVPDYNVNVIYLSLDNNFKVSKKITTQLSSFYYSPQITGIFRRSPRFNVNLNFRYKINEQWDLALFANDILKTQQGKLKAIVNSVQQTYDNYYDSRSIRLSISFRFGSMNINARQRNFISDKEKQRAY
ncbi:outer membrane beta-barrel family protein [Sphingobacterium sp. UBA5996]|uniref:outer membrane beta-barrel family protein n=1 Tax=Sphingobacterium sp. UBA5996 TaxID=1947505 RepID=UPI0025D37647|nr:outer membrane beta-barrel family protein [Sphingobacterium sp. UBA5996]